MNATSTERIFGTDGIRGPAGQGLLGAESLLRIARALATSLEDRRGRILIGHDGRRSSGMIRGALEAGLLASGFDVTTVGLITTPGLSYLTRTLPCELGIMISASHNPPGDNGIKIFDHRGGKLPDAVEERISALTLTPGALAIDEDQKPGLAEHTPELTGLYRDALLERCPGLALDGMRIALDCANGGGSSIAVAVFEALGAEVLAFACDPTGDNINVDCGAVHPENLAAFMRAHDCGFGLALDGDGDRVMLVDETYGIVDGDGMLYVLAKDRQDAGKLESGAIVVTVMSNLGLRRALEPLSIEREIVAVGDRHVVKAMREKELDLGGEPSGHVIFADNHWTGDGIVTALEILGIMRRRSAALHELHAAFQSYPQLLDNVRVSERRPLESCPHLQDVVANVERRLGADGRVVIRYSGTESLLRVMLEGPQHGLIRSMADEILAAIQRDIPLP